MQAIGQPDTIQGTSREERPRIDAPRHRWLYTTNPLAWQLVDYSAIGLDEDEYPEGKRFEWLPRMKQMPLKAGVNGVRARGKNIDWKMTEVIHNRWGDQIVPESLAPNGTSYRVAIAAQDGTRYADAWTTYKQVGHNWMPRFDRKAFTEWRRSLVVEGHIEAPELDDLEGQARAFERAVERKRREPAYQGTQALADAEARLAAMRDPASLPTYTPPKTTSKRKTTKRSSK